MPRSARAVAAFAVAALVLSVLFALTRSKVFFADHDELRVTGTVATVPPHGVLCQGPSTEPFTKGTAGVQYYVSSAGLPTPPLRVTMRSGDGVASTAGRLAGGYQAGAVTIPVTPIEQSRTGSVTCLHNDGPTAVSLGGQSTTGTGFFVNGKENPALVRIDYVRAGSSTWLGMLGTIAHRFGIMKTTIAGAWTFWAVLALMLLAAALALRTLLRGGSEQEPA